jgi:serine/threonine protein kinase
MSTPSASSSVSGQWENVKVVGKGGSSTVYKAHLKTDPPQLIAVKQIDTDGLRAEQISGIQLEIAMMKELHHPNIISFLGMEQTSNKIYILMEYANRGSLRQYYQKRGPLKEAQVASCTRQILTGLAYLHSKGIAHRDVKCANCLLTAGKECKLADFGASKQLETDSIVSGLKGKAVLECNTEYLHL